MYSAIIYFKLSFATCSHKTIAYTIGLMYSGPLVLRFIIFTNNCIIKDRNQTVLQRSKPSSCTILIGEQPNPWNPLQLQDMISRHRGAKHFCR